MNEVSLSANIKAIADNIGLDVLGFADASEFSNYLLHDSIRRNPKLSLPGARTIIVAGVYIGGLRLPSWKDPNWGRTSRLYLSSFFLDVIKPIEPIANYLTKNGYRAIVSDSSTEKGSILPLKLAAVRAGLGWQGKHSLLISKKYGTFLALGGIITDASLEINTKEEPDRCRNCKHCQAACPLDALHEPYVLNRNKCMSHLFMAESLTEKVAAVMENRIGDCEICQDACPWNRKHLMSPLWSNITEYFQKEIEYLQDIFYLPHLVELSETEYNKIFGRFNTGIPYEIFRRNVSMANERAKSY